jgi:hypothetical protein
MNLLNPLPDEVTWGYADRLDRMLGPVALQPLKAQFESSYPKGRQKVPFLAHAAGLTVEQFLQKHTTVPFTYCVSGMASGDSFEKVACYLDASSLAPRGDSVHLCPLCCEEDLGWYGFSYWRRSHQLAGIYDCPKHNTALLRPRSVPYNRQQPHEIADTSRPAISHEELEKIRTNPFCIRYAETAASLLNLMAPIRADLFLRRLMAYWGAEPSVCASMSITRRRPIMEKYLSKGRLNAARSNGRNLTDILHTCATTKLRMEAHPSWLQSLLRARSGAISVERLIVLGLCTKQRKLGSVRGGVSRVAAACIVCTSMDDAQNLFNRHALERWIASIGHRPMPASPEVPAAAVPSG